MERSVMPQKGLTGQSVLVYLPSVVVICINWVTTVSNVMDQKTFNKENLDPKGRAISHLLAEDEDGLPCNSQPKLAIQRERCYKWRLPRDFLLFFALELYLPEFKTLP